MEKKEISFIEKFAAAGKELEKAIKEADVNLRTNSRIVTYDAPCSPDKITSAVSGAGYGFFSFLRSKTSGG